MVLLQYLIPNHRYQYKTFSVYLIIDLIISLIIFLIVFLIHIVATYVQYIPYLNLYHHYRYILLHFIPNFCENYYF